jgi:hypothetical protein
MEKTDVCSSASDPSSAIFLARLVVHFVIEHNFAGSLADLVRNLTSQLRDTYPDLTREVPLSLLLLLRLLSIRVSSLLTRCLSTFILIP